MEVPGVVEGDALAAALFRGLRPDLRDIIRSDVGTVWIGEDKTVIGVSSDKLVLPGFSSRSLLSPHNHNRWSL